MYRLIVTAKKVVGECSVHREGDKIVIESPFIRTDRTDNVCMFALGSLSPFLSLGSLPEYRETSSPAYKHGKDPVISGMCTDVACPAAGGSICNGYVVFKIEREKIE